jgi:transposase-like protein
MPRMLSIIVERNPGSYYDVLHFPNPIDNTFLIGKYKGQIITTIDMDDNHKTLLLAFTFLENENTDIWYWFLERVKTQVGCRPDVCLISDRHFGIWAAIHQLNTGSGTHAPLWPSVQSRWCMRHMAANFYSHFNNKDLMNLFNRLCSQNQERKSMLMESVG